MSKKYTVKSLDETEHLAREIADKTKAGTILALIGDLGTGKTTFAQAFARALGITVSVGSPTFKLISEYQGKVLWLYHIDCYRIENIQQFINIGGDEYLYNKNGITVIEWADIIEDILPHDATKIYFKRISENPNFREIIIKN